MTMYQLRVLLTAFAWWLGRRREPAVRLEVEHRHWDRAARTWAEHEELDSERLAA